MAEELLFHYCSTPTAFAILQSRTFRLSALSSANDSLEGRVLGRVFGQLLGETNLPPGVVDVASLIVEGYPNSTEGFALCLSEKPDLLSQWRAYGSDGCGVAIGFSPEALKADYGQVNFGSNFFELRKVAYREAQLRQNLVPIVESFFEEMARYGDFIKIRDGITREQALAIMSERGQNTANLIQGKNEASRDLLVQMLDLLAPLHFKVYDTKPEYFHEECEWRVIRYRHKVALPEIEYSADQHSIKPYIECLIADPAIKAIREVVLGPKHKSSLDWVEGFLKSVGLPHVLVKRSAISRYR